MNYKIIIAVLVMAMMPCHVMGQGVTRAELAQKKVDRNGNFRYWTQDSPALARLKDFVARVTDPSSKDFVAVKDRIATFDVDGTLVCETAPFYMNWILCFHRYLHDASYVPDEEERKLMAEYEEYVLKNHASTDEMGDVVQFLQAKSFRGMTQREFSDYIGNFLDTVSPMGLSNLTWGTAIYWPMIEAVSYLVANNFKVYICSGVDRDVCRVLTKDIFDIPAYQMMTSDVNYVMESQAANGEWTERLNAESYQYKVGEEIVRGDMKQLCTAINKIVIMRRELGQKPILSWGNSSGDFPMFHYTNLDNPLPHISFCLICDDTKREFGNPGKAEKCRLACEEYGWVPVSMSNEWTTIYGPGVEVVSPTAVTAPGAPEGMSTKHNIKGQGISTPMHREVYIENGVKKMRSY